MNSKNSIGQPNKQPKLVKSKKNNQEQNKQPKNKKTVELIRKQYLIIDKAYGLNKPRLTNLRVGKSLQIQNL